MAFWLPALSILKAGVEGISQIAGGKQEKAGAEESARVLDDNARMAEKQAYEALAVGYRNANKAYGQAARVMSGQRQAASGSGVAMDFGVTDSLFDETVHMSRLDAHHANRNARMNYDNSMAQAANYRKQASAVRAGGQAAYDQALFSAGSSFATGGLGAYKKWKDYSSSSGDVVAV